METQKLMELNLNSKKEREYLRNILKQDISTRKSLLIINLNFYYALMFGILASITGAIFHDFFKTVFSADNYIFYVGVVFIFLLGILIVIHQDFTKIKKDLFSLDLALINLNSLEENVKINHLLKKELREKKEKVFKQS